MIVDESVFNKWRALIALAHVDGKVTKEEWDFLTGHFGKLVPDLISKHQYNVLMQDLDEPKGAEVFFTRIDDKVERLDFLRLAHFLFWSDGHFDIREKTIFKQMRQSVGRSLNMSEEDIDQLVSLDGQKKTLREVLVEDLQKRKSA